MSLERQGNVACMVNPGEECGSHAASPWPWASPATAFRFQKKCDFTESLMIIITLKRLIWPLFEVVLFNAIKQLSFPKEMYVRGSGQEKSQKLQCQTD